MPVVTYWDKGRDNKKTEMAIHHKETMILKVTLKLYLLILLYEFPLKNA